MEVSGFLLLISTVFLHNVSCCSIINVNISASSDSAVITWETSEDCSKVVMVDSHLIIKCYVRLIIVKSDE